MTAHSQPLDVRHIPAVAWLDSVQQLIDSGYGFTDLHTAGEGDTQQLRASFQRGGHLAMLCSPVDSAAASSIIDLAPAARRDECEAAERSAIQFIGHDAVPQMSHDAPLEQWTTHVSGADTHQVAVGPIHAGIIEGGHFRFHVVGERILHLDLRMFYNHRGLERAAEGRTLADAIGIVGCACTACSVANTVAYAQAAEQALGISATENVARARTVLLELERCYNHLHDLGAACAGVGFALGTNAFAELKERAQRINDRLTGHRFCSNTIRVGGSDLQITPDTAAAVRTELREIGDASERAWRETLFNGSVHNRLRGIGFITHEQAIQLGVVGPTARASGVVFDTRQHSPGLAYHQFQPTRLEDPSGDVRARIEMRAIELTATIAILDELLAAGMAPGECEQAGDDVPIGAAVVESPRGRTFCSVEHESGHVRRLRLRTGSYANWPAVAASATGEILPEFPLINKSFELCYACSDR